MFNKHKIAQEFFAKYDAFKDIDEYEKTWLGTIKNCDTCSRPMEPESYMIDGPVNNSKQSQWGNLCVVCAFKHIAIIAWGGAQLYKQKNSQWYLIAGGPQQEHEHQG
nr:hypothetical protein BN993_03196 [Virgibacillus halodenitrificans]